MRLSIVIPLYLGRDVLAQCLESLSGCDAGECEIIVVDDCSPDGAGALVKSTYPRVLVVTNDTNLGYAASVNLGLSVARGDLIMLLNQDTVVSEEAVAALAATIEERDDIVAIAPQLLNLDGSVQKSCRTLPTHLDVIYHHLLLTYVFPNSRTVSRWRMPWFSHNEEIIVEQPSFSAIMIRHSTIREIGPLDERFRIFFNDVDYCRRIAQSGGKILFLPSAKVKHQRGQATAQLPFRKIVDSHRGFVLYFLKHYRGAIYFLPNLLILVLLTISGALRFVWQAVAGLFTSE